MKKNLLLAFIGFVSFNLFAADYACKESYEKAFAHVAQTAKRDNRIVFGTTAGTMLVESGFFNTTIIAGSLAVYNPVAMGVFFAGVGFLYYEGDKLSSRLTARDIIEESFNGRDGLVDTMERGYYELKNSEAEYRLAYKVNPKRKKKHQPELSMEDYLKQNPIPTFSREDAPTPLTVLTKKISEKSGKKVDYEAVAAVVRSLAHDDSFCPKGKVFGKRHLQKLVQSKL